MGQILFDTPKPHPQKNGKWSHLVASDIKTLHAFAQKIGLKKCWFQNKRGKKQPHYDLRESLTETAMAHGAAQVPRREIFLFLKAHYS